MEKQTRAIAELNHFIILDKYTREWETCDCYQSETDLEHELVDAHD